VVLSVKTTQSDHSDVLLFVTSKSEVEQ